MRGLTTNRFRALTTILLLLLCVCSFAESENSYVIIKEWFSCKNTKKSVNEAFKQDTAVLKQRANLLDKSDSFSALLTLWIRGEEEFVRLKWWEKDDKESRLVITAIILCERIEDDETNEFIWRAKRFENVESLERINEISFVLSNRKLFATQICRILQAQQQNENLKRRLEDYEYVAKKAKVPQRGTKEAARKRKKTATGSAGAPSNNK